MNPFGLTTTWMHVHQLSRQLNSVHTVSISNCTHTNSIHITDSIVFNQLVYIGMETQFFRH